MDPSIPGNPFTFLENWEPFLHKGIPAFCRTALTVASNDLLSMTGRTQAFNLGESFAENYAFSLLNESHKYRIEYGGNPPKEESQKKDQNRVWETACWFSQGFWGVNASEHVILKGIPETPGKSCSRLGPENRIRRAKFATLCELSSIYSDCGRSQSGG